MTGRQETGIWYLHALAEHENGSAAHTYRQFTFLQPELRVTVMGSGWTKAKTLSVTASGTTGTYTLSYVCPGNAAIETGEYSSAQTAEHTVTTAGTYTVTLTDGYQNVLSETVTVSQIDGYCRQSTFPARIPTRCITNSRCTYRRPIRAAAA